MSKNGGKGSAKAGGAASPAKIDAAMLERDSARLLSKGAVEGPAHRAQDLVRQEIAARALKPQAPLVGNPQPTPARIQGRVEDMVRADLVRLYARREPGGHDEIARKVQRDDQYGRQLHRVDPKIFQAVATEQSRLAVKTHTKLDGPQSHQLPQTDPYRAGKLAAEQARANGHVINQPAAQTTVVSHRARSRSM